MRPIAQVRRRYRERGFPDRLGLGRTVGLGRAVGPVDLVGPLLLGTGLLDTGRWLNGTDRRGTTGMNWSGGGSGGATGVAVGGAVEVLGGGAGTGAVLLR